MQTGQHLAERALHIPCSHTAFPAPTCRLFDLPKPSITSLQSQPTETTQYHPYAQYSLKKLQASLEAFRTSLPDSESRPNDVSTDPWWIFTRANLAAADMLFFAEYAVYQPVMFEHALNAAKRMVELVEGIRIETYAHLGRCSLDSRLIISQTWMRAVRCLDLELIFCRFLSLFLLHYCLVVNTFCLASLLIGADCFVFLDISLVARFLYREANRAAQENSDRPAFDAIEADADKLLKALEEKAGRWHPFGLHLGEDVRRLKQGLGTRPGLYPRSK